MGDLDLRNAALFGVQRLWRRFGDSVPYAAIEGGFEHAGERIPFLSAFEGVYKPAALQTGVLSIRSTLGSRYEDERISDDRVWYEYSPKGYQNDRLRESMMEGHDLLYFLQVKPKPGVEYLVFAPVRVIEDAPGRRAFLIDLSPSALYEGTPDVDARLHQVMERRYSATEIRTRLFQAHFRREVLRAYRDRCAICHLRERPVLDGAHLVPDREELGVPRVSNGLALCALHHRTFDRDLIGITPDFKLHVFRDRLEQVEEEATDTAVGRFHNRALSLPTEKSHQPDRDLVAIRWGQALER